MTEDDPVIESVAISAAPARGWVTVDGRLRADIVYPVVELTVLSKTGERLTGTMIVDAQPEYRMTLHTAGAAPGAELVLRVEVIQSDQTLAVQEYEFRYVADEPLS